LSIEHASSCGYAEICLTHYFLSSTKLGYDLYRQISSPIEAFGETVKRTQAWLHR
jgi:hypothetical protein